MKWVFSGYASVLACVCICGKGSKLDTFCILFEMFDGVCIYGYNQFYGFCVTVLFQ